MEINETTMNQSNQEGNGASAETGATSEQTQTQEPNDSNKAGQTVVTATTNKQGAGQGEPITTFSQEDVNRIVNERLERQHSSFLKKYDFANDDAIGDMIGRSQAYDVMKMRLAETRQKLSDSNKNLAFAKNNIADNRYGDIEAYFKGKGLDLNNDNLVKELGTHPEWIKSQVNADSQVPPVKILGTDRTVINTQETPEQKQKRIFGV